MESEHDRETHLAIRNMLILGGSLVATWSVALVVRLGLPRALGPERFGAFAFAESLATTAAVVLGLGADTYVQKEIPTRPAHGSEFLGGVLATRLVMAVLVLAVTAFVVGDRAPEVRRTVLVFGLAQFAFVNANTLAAFLHASRRVGWLAVLNVVSKVMWGAGLAVAMFLRSSLEVYAFAFLASETLRTVVLLHLVRSRAGLELRVAPSSLRRMLWASLPFYVNAAAITVYAKIAVTIMAMHAPDIEVGWYGAATNVAAIGMLFTPLVDWVMMPQFSRAAARGPEELRVVFRRSLELLLGATLPISALIAVSAPVCIRVLFGEAFEGAAPSLRILAPMFSLSYVAMIAASCLIMLGRGWVTTAISVASVIVNVALNVVAIGPALRALGPGGAGIGAATIAVGTELAVVVAMLVAIGRAGIDRRLIAVAVKSLGVSAAVVGIHIAFPSLGAARLVLDVTASAVLVVVTGTIPVVALWRSVRAALASRNHVEIDREPDPPSPLRRSGIVRLGAGDTGHDGVG